MPPPVVYPVSIVPERWRLLYSLNPMAGVIEGFRWALLGKESPDFVVNDDGKCIRSIDIIGKWDCFF